MVRSDRKFFSDTRTNRHIAFVVLLMCLFALASGVVNACLLEVRQTHSHFATAASSETLAHGYVIFPGHAGVVTDGMDASHFKTPCLKVCDDGARSFPKQDSTVAQADPGPAPLAVVLWNTVAPVIPAFRHMEIDQPAKPEPPIRIRFPRLAI